MILISTSYLLTFARDIERLSALPTKSTRLGDIFTTLLISQIVIENMYSPQSIYRDYMRISTRLAVQLHGLLTELVNMNDLDFQVEEHRLVTILATCNELRTVVTSEMQALNLFLITTKGPYDVTGLINAGERIFPPDLQAKVPEALVDVIKGAQCLAFELPTACGFHIFRALEAVLRRYYSVVTGGKAQPKVRNISVYIHAMQQSGCGDPKILSALKQISDLHRNPLIHPDINLEVEEALAVVGIARSVVGQMLKVLPFEAEILPASGQS